jgi:predicted lysophospholipase L1 biosynthesis ABC-type transport system permease subunit
MFRYVQICQADYILAGSYCNKNWWVLAGKGSAGPQFTMYISKHRQALTLVRTMNQVMAENVSRARFNTLLLGLFAGLATLLAAVGIFGVINYSVILRTREIGIRMALGAQQGQVLMLILKQGLRLTLIGIGIGLAGTFISTEAASTPARTNDEARRCAADRSEFGKQQSQIRTPTLLS